MIEDVFKDIRAKIPMSTGENLLGFKCDCNAFFEHPIFKSVHIAYTGDHARMLEATIELNDTAVSIEELEAILLRLYGSVAYKHYSCHEISKGEESLRLKFITVIDDDRFYVSGEIRVVGDRYRSLH